MKKIVILSVILAFAFFACGGSNTDYSNNTNSTSTDKNMESKKDMTDNGKQVMDKNSGSELTTNTSTVNSDTSKSGQDNTQTTTTTKTNTTPKKLTKEERLKLLKEGIKSDVQ